MPRDGGRGRRIFISYRRGDTSGQARALAENLTARFGRGRVFMDVDSIAPGTDFVAKIDEAISACSAVLALIGRDWAGSPGGTTHPLDDPNDFVRREIESALQRQVPIIPILVERAPMPPASMLPESLQPLTRLNALEVENSRWSFDVSRLADAIEKIPVPPRVGATTPPSASPALSTPPPSAAVSGPPQGAPAPASPPHGAVNAAPPAPPSTVAPPPQPPPTAPRPERRLRRPWLLAGAGGAVAVVVAVVVVVILVTRNHPCCTPPPAPHPTPTAASLSSALLNPRDFASGATTGSASDVPDLDNVKCTPNATSGLQQQYKSEVKAASGRVYGNILAAFDTSSDATSFINAFFNLSKTCSDASSSPTQENFGDLSFSFTISGSPNDLSVDTVQVGRYITMVIQVLPDGTQADQQSLSDLTQTSVDKLSKVAP